MVVLSAMISHIAPHRRPDSPPNGALAEALFALAEQEEPGDRRVSLLKAGYAVFDTTGGGRRAALATAPEWLRPLIEQLAACRGEDALAAAVHRLATGDRPRRRSTRERYLCRAEVPAILNAGPVELHPDRMRGAAHWHTTDSDGKTALETMARACRRRGFAWSMVTDHSKGLEVASGLDAEGLRIQRSRIDSWNRSTGDEHRVFQGLEVEVLEDGTLDVARGERFEVECVVAAIHRLFDPDRDQTERLLRTIATPGVHVLAHPRARHFHHRPGLRARWETVFAACAERGVAVEINGFPRRQDLDWELARLAVEAGCDFLLASDAHAPRHLEFDAYAAAIAVKAEVPRNRILNVMHADEFEMWLGER
jgi:histidinol phosphatase-like PHP family hydrolase